MHVDKSTSQQKCHNNTLGTLHHHRGLHVVRRMVVEGMHTLHGLAEPPDSTETTLVEFSSSRFHKAAPVLPQQYIEPRTPVSHTEKIARSRHHLSVDFENPGTVTSSSVKVLGDTVPVIFQLSSHTCMHQKCFVLSLDWQIIRFLSSN